MPSTRSPKAPPSAPSSTREALRLRGPSRRQLSRHQREQRMRRSIVVGSVVLLATIVGVIGFGYWRENYGRAQETAAVIFGERITTGDLVLEARPRLIALDRRIDLYRSNGLSQQATQLQFQRSQIPESTINALVEERLIRREAANRGIVVTPAEVDERLRKDVAQADAFNQPQPTATVAPASPTPAASPAGTPTARPTATPVPTLTGDRFGPALQDYLNQSGYAESQLRRDTEAELTQDKLRTAIGEEIPAIQEQVHARHIVFKSQDDANAALQQLQSGADFAQLAASQSQDQATKDKGGDLGWLPRAERDPVFDDVLFSLQAGQLSGVVQTGSGWEIVQATERDPSRPVDSPLLDELRRRHFGDWLAAAEGSPEIDRQLTPEKTDWVLQRAAKK